MADFSGLVVAAVMGFSYVFQNGGGFIASPIDMVVSMVFGADAIMSSVWIFDIVLGIVVLVCLFFVARNANRITAERDAELAAE